MSTPSMCTHNDTFPLMELPADLLGYLFLFLGGRATQYFKNVNNKQMNALIYQHTRHVKNTLGESMELLMDHLPHFTRLTHFEFVEAGFKMGMWNATTYSNKKFYIIDLIHLPQTLQHIKVYGDRAVPLRGIYHDKEWIADKRDAQLQSTLGTFPCMNPGSIRYEEDWSRLRDDKTADYDYMTIDCVELDQCLLLDRLFSHDRYPHLITLDIRFRFASITPRCLAHRSSLETLRGITLRKTPQRSLIPLVSLPPYLSRLELINKQLDQKLVQAVVSFPPTLTCFEFVPDQHLKMEMLLPALPYALKTLKLQQDHFHGQGDVYTSYWFKYLPSTLETLILRQCLTEDEDLQCLPPSLTCLEGEFSGDFSYKSFPRQLKTLHFTGFSSVPLDKFNELPPELRSFKTLFNHEWQLMDVLNVLPTSVHTLYLNAFVVNFVPWHCNESQLPALNNLRTLKINFNSQLHSTCVTFFKQHYPHLYIRNLSFFD